MSVNTYVELDKKTVSVGGVASVEFTSVPQNYTDLLIVGSVKIGSSGNYIGLQFNSDTSNNYARTRLYANGTTTAAERESSSGRINIYNQSNAKFGSNIIHIMNYSNTTTFKTSIIRSDISDWNTNAQVGLYRSTSAITSIQLGTVGDYAIGTTFSLYGIKAWAAETTPKATGGYVYSDTNYWYHAFPFSSTFTPSQSLTADILVVAGGGGGGTSSNNDAGGAGGAGGFLVYTGQSLTATNYTCTVGSGGAGAASSGLNGSSGTNSQFASLTASVGGGYGAGESASRAGGTGGSGGGGGGYTGAAGTGTSGQGNNGAAANVGSTGAGGGGGGAGGAASERTGGIGSSTYSSWGLATKTGHVVNGIAYYAGGGGGGADSRFGSPIAGLGGAGGGGNGQNDQSGATKASNGIVSTGGGGGGSASSRTGSSPAWIPAGSGGSGLVIVRYAK